MTANEVRVYDTTGVTMLAVLDKATGVQWRHGLAGDGSSAGIATFSLMASDPKAQHIARDRIVKMALDGVEVCPFRIAARQLVLTDQGWRYDVTALQGRVLLGDAVALPEYGVRVGAGETRRFGFMSVVGAWFVGSEWVTPGTVALSAYAPWQYGMPNGYPDASSYWLSAPTQPPVGGKTWYRATFSTTVTYASVRLFVAVDDTADVYLDGELVMQITGSATTYRSTTTADVLLPVGDHVLAVEMRDDYAPSGEGLIGELLCCLASMSTSADGTDVVTQVILRSNASPQWLVRSDNTTMPGWRKAQIVKQLFTEGTARGARGCVALTLDFTDTVDTAGVAWSDRGDYEVQTFNDKLDRITEALFDPSLDWDVSPDMKLQAWNRRGENRTGPTSTPAGTGPVVLKTAVDVTDLTLTEGYDVVTSLYGRTADGLVVHQSDSTAETEAGGVVEGGMSLGSVSNADTANGVMAAHLDSLGYPQTEVTASLSPDGPKPYVDYFLGDTVLVETDAGYLPVRVLGFTVDASGDVVTVVPEVALDRTVTL